MSSHTISILSSFLLSEIVLFFFYSFFLQFFLPTPFSAGSPFAILKSLRTAIKPARNETTRCLCLNIKLIGTGGLVRLRRFPGPRVQRQCSRQKHRKYLFNGRYRGTWYQLQEDGGTLYLDVFLVFFCFFFLFSVFFFNVQSVSGVVNFKAHIYHLLGAKIIAPFLWRVARVKF